MAGEPGTWWKVLTEQWRVKLVGSKSEVVGSSSRQPLQEGQTQAGVSASSTACAPTRRAGATDQEVQRLLCGDRALNHSRPPGQTFQADPEFKVHGVNVSAEGGRWS